MLNVLLDDLGLLRSKVDAKAGKKYSEAYHKIVPISEPAKDYDARMALYALYDEPCLLAVPWKDTNRNSSP